MNFQSWTENPRVGSSILSLATIKRLNIRKATLREWRREFARHLRNQGIEANATERAVPGESRARKLDGIYRAAERGDSKHTRARAEAVAQEHSRYFAIEHLELSKRCGGGAMLRQITLGS